MSFTGWSPGQSQPSTQANYHRILQTILETGKLPPEIKDVSLLNVSDQERELLLQALGNKNKGPGGGAGAAPPALLPPGGFAPGVPGATPGPGAGGAPGAGGGAPGKPGNTIYEQLLAQYQKSYDEARAANESRYQDILKGYQTRYDRALTGLAGLGQQEKSDTRQVYADVLAKEKQGLVSSGLYNSTNRPAVALGVAKEEQNAINRIDDRLNTQRIGYETGLSGDLLRFQEARNDTYPDYGQLAQLAQALGTSGYGNAVYTPPTPVTAAPPAPVKVKKPKVPKGPATVMPNPVVGRPAPRSTLPTRYF